MLVTVNVARRDAETMGQVYSFLGLTRRTSTAQRAAASERRDLRDQLRARLRLPPRQPRNDRGRGGSPSGAPLLRRRRGRLGARGRGARAARHLRQAGHGTVHTVRKRIRVNGRSPGWGWGRRLTTPIRCQVCFGGEARRRALARRPLRRLRERADGDDVRAGPRRLRSHPASRRPVQPDRPVGRLRRQRDQGERALCEETRRTSSARARRSSSTSSQGE